MGDLREECEERDFGILLFGVRAAGLIGDFPVLMDDFRSFFFPEVLESLLLAAEGFLDLGLLADVDNRCFFFALGRAMKLSEREKEPGVAPGEKKVSSLDWESERFLAEDRIGLWAVANNTEEAPKENFLTYSSCKK